MAKTVNNTDPTNNANTADAPPPAYAEAVMREALAEARQAAARGEVPVGAVVYRLPGTGEAEVQEPAAGPAAGGLPKVLARAHNLRETHADPTAHAEVLALRDAAAAQGTWRLDACGLAVTLEPCPMCAGALVNARLGELIYGCPDPKAGCVHTLYRLCNDPRFNHRVAVTPGVLADDCAHVLRRFFQARRDKAAHKDKPGPAAGTS